ncbi:MAG: hypothetical protein GY934_09800 [Gammaproteobacteria bacterium]|nr:hypothetical protein [Gammaproteobacteria bacterium]
MLLKIIQGARRGTMKRKFMLECDIITDEDLEQVDAFAKKYKYSVGYCDVLLIEHQKVEGRVLPKQVTLDEVTHIL